MANYIKKMAGNCCSPTNNGTTLSLSELIDVNVLNPTNGLILQYNAVSQKWEAVNNNGNGGQEITEITAENKDAALAAATNIVFKYGIILVSEGDYYIVPNDGPRIGVYVNINGNDIPLPIDYIYEFLKHLSCTFVVDGVYFTVEEGGEPVEESWPVINIPNEQFIIKGPDATLINCSHGFYFIATPSLEVTEYMGEYALYNENKLHISVSLSDTSSLDNDYVKDNNAIEYGFNNILKVYSIPGPGCLTVQGCPNNMA